MIDWKPISTNVSQPKINIVAITGEGLKETVNNLVLTSGETVLTTEFNDHIAGTLPNTNINVIQMGSSAKSIKQKIQSTYDFRRRDHVSHT